MSLSVARGGGPAGGTARLCYHGGAAPSGPTLAGPAHRQQEGDVSDAELCYLTACDLAEQIRRREISPVEVAGAVLRRIERLNPALGAYCTLTAETALDQARRRSSPSRWASTSPPRWREGRCPASPGRPSPSSST